MLLSSRAALSLLQLGGACVGGGGALSLGEAGEAARRDAAGEGDRDESGDAL